MASQFQPRFLQASRFARPLGTYVALVVVAGLLVGGWLLWLLRKEAATFGHAGGTFWLTFWLLAACALPAEIVRVTVRHQGGEYELTMSRPFVLALLTGWGAPLAVPVFVVVSVVSDLVHRKPAVRIPFNAGQYVLSIAAADAIYTALGGDRSFALGSVPAFVAASLVLLAVNRLLVRVAVALHEQHPMTVGYVLTYGRLVDSVEAAVQLGMVLVALLVAQHQPLLAVLLALPAVPLFAFGQAAEQLQALRARRRGLGGNELADLEQRREAVLQTVELERVRFAADLHDGPVQRLGQHVERLRMVQASIEAGSPDVARQLHQLEQDATAESRTLRDLVAALRPPVLQDRGLAGAITRLAQEFQTSYGGIVFDVQTRAVDGLSEKLEVMLYRVVQEALTNVVKHAHASHVQVAVAVDDGVVRLQVHDDGTGFDLTPVQRDGHYGLALMRKWVELAGGAFDVDSMRGRNGTTITVEIQSGVLP